MAEVKAVAARHLNFEKAGDEIAVTASAIGQHVKSMEMWCGCPLFLRLPAKDVTLTPDRQRYTANVGKALDLINEGTARVVWPRTSRTSTVSTLPGFAVSWLIPRLSSLKECYPDLEVRLSVSRHQLDFARESVDLAVRLGHGGYPGLQIDLLFEKPYFAVCSSALFNDSERPLLGPEDLRHHTLLHEISENVPHSMTWSRWLEAIGVEGIDTSQGRHFWQTLMALQAAASIGDYLVAGSLIWPFPHQVRGAYQYYIGCPEATGDRSSILDFRAWFLDEAKVQTNVEVT